VADDRRHLLTAGMGAYTQSGMIGRPSLGSAEKGKAVLASLVESFAAVLELLQRE
jgi:creatinine amidohydrolase